jgi:pyruvate/2-oxoglutarate dehydrogenase complex dihydrolipoamide dehydrogenase (E3) component
VSKRVVVLGGGATGEAFCGALRRLDETAEITLVERGLVGGECSYFACMPSKTLLRAPELLASARRAPGAAEAMAGALDLDRVFWWRDQVVGGLDDSAQAKWLAERRIELVRAHARVPEVGVVEADGRRLAYDALLLATGSAPAIPPLPGLDAVDSWTTRDATSAAAVPESLVVLGGGVAGCELAQLYRRLGARVTIVQRSPRLLPRVDAEAAELLEAAFGEDGIELRLGAQVEGVEPAGAGVRVTLASGETLDAERLLVATGRRPNVDGLEPLGLELTPGGVVVDEHLRAADGAWAAGDVTGVALFTHVGKYQGRVAAANVAGTPAKADYRAIPSVAFTDPQIAQVGTLDGEGLVAATWRVDRTGRSSTYERPKRPGFVKLVADPGRGVLVGAVAAGPESGEWLGQLALAVRAEVPIDVLRDTIQPYPTFSEAIFFAARDLPL